MAGQSALAATPPAASPLAAFGSEYRLDGADCVVVGAWRLGQAAFGWIKYVCSCAFMSYNGAIMAEAKITLPDGIVLVVSGTPDEITAVVARLQGGESASRTVASPTGRSRAKTPSGRAQLTELVRQLIESGLFKQPKDLGAVKAALEERGHHFPVTTLSPALLRQVRKRNLRRLKQGNRWVYTG
jgi:hypothetical protein